MKSKRKVRGTTVKEAPLFLTLDRLGLNYNCELIDCGSNWSRKTINDRYICDWCYQYYEGQVPEGMWNEK